MRRSIVLASLALAGLPAFRAAADGEPAEDPRSRIFFREPDKETGARIAELIASMAVNSVIDRADARHKLEAIGYWSVDPLIEAVSKMEPPKRCSAILVLDAIHDRRALEPLRAAVVKDTVMISGFAALALGRFRDAGAVDAIRTALKTPKSMDKLKEAVPFALAKIRTSEARDVLLERVRAPGVKEPARSAALASLGFFPELALSGNAAAPSADLAAGLTSKRRGERQAALVGLLVASWSRGDVKAYLKEVLASDSAPEVCQTALIGLSRSTDADVTELLAKTAERQGDDHVRELAADLLIDRVDAATKPIVEQIARTTASARLRAACVLALGRLEDEDARRLVIDRLSDHAPIVRAAAAVALTRRVAPAVRDAAIQAIEARIKRGEPNDFVKADLEGARAVLLGERTDVQWTEIRPDVIFSEMSLTYVQRLLREVNRRLMVSLDLAKIENLQTDAEIVPQGPPIMPESGGGDQGGSSSGGESGSGEGEGGGSSGGESDSSGGSGSGSSGSGSSGEPNAGGNGAPGTSPGEVPGNSSGQTAEGPSTVGSARTSQYQELRDLKYELYRNPYFGFDDLPSPPTTPSGK